VTLAWLPFLLAAGTVVCSAEIKEIEELKERAVRLREQSRWTEAVPPTEQLVKMMTAHYGHDHTNTVEALHWLAWLVQQNGDYYKAEKLWLEALAIDEKLFGKGTIQTTRRLHLLANLYREQGDYDRAARLLQTALEIREKHLGPDHPDTAQIVRSLGILDSRSGDYAGAVAYLSRARKILQKPGLPPADSLHAVLSALGWVYLMIGDHQQAEQCIGQALDFCKQLHGREHETTAARLHECALMYRAKGELEKAKQLLGESLGIRQKLLGTNHVSLATTLNTLGQVMMSKEDWDGAEALFERERAVLVNHLGEEHPDVSSPLSGLSRVYESRGEYARARSFCERAYTIRESRFGPAHPRTLPFLQELARLEGSRGNPEWALTRADEIQSAEEALLANALSFTCGRQRVDLKANFFFLRNRYSLWADLNAPEPLARAILRTKGLALDSSLEDRRIAEASDDPHLRDLVARLREQQQRLTELRQNPTNADRREIRNISEEVESLEAELARNVTGLGATRRILSVEVDQVRSALPVKSVLLEMIRYRHYKGNAKWQDGYGVLILSPEEKTRWVHLGPADAIERGVKMYQHALRSRGAAQLITESLKELYSLLWRPLEKELPARAEQVIISPDGDLNFVSFATLLTPVGRLLGEEHLFTYVSCARDLITETKRTAKQDLLIWANPDFGEPAEAAHARNFRALPSAECEGRKLCSRATELGFSNAVLHLGSQATEAELFRVHSPMVLHLATHGFVLPAKLPDLAPEEAGSGFEFQRTQVGRPDPMLHSGIALAGAQRTFQLWAEGKPASGHDDGIVTAAEIGALDLQGTWLVVLSACDSGLGEARAGEGVFGLRRAFIQAGAQNLLLTLWPVDDQQTLELMLDFYGELKDAKSPAAALAHVQRSWLKKLRTEKGVAEACRIAGPFILNSQGAFKPAAIARAAL
jgi:CHAT domain-containing protein/Tfp pilus assembly protein PilF